MPAAESTAMKNKTAGIAIAFSIIAFVLVWAVTDAFRGVGTLELGSLTLEYNRRLEAVQGLTATTSITDGNYDSFDSPGGTSFAPGTGSFVVGGILANSGSVDLRIDYGYGDTHVENSASAPTNPVTAGSLIIPAGVGLTPVDVFMKVPRGKHPFARVVGQASNGHITLLGFVESDQ